MKSINNLNSQIEQDNKFKIAQNQITQISPLKKNKDVQLQKLKQIKLDPAKNSNKKNGIIQSYGANTHQGNVRPYNEDRVSIILNMVRPENKKSEFYWPECSFFAVYDGHGGAKCADYLRDHLHQLIIRDEYFPQNPIKSINRCIYKVEQNFVQSTIEKGNKIDKSGSCLIMMLLVDKKCYIANVGDSRAILFSQKNNKIIQLSQDHKPNLENEKKRIIENGGQIYYYVKSQNPNSLTPQIIYGPFRVYPGRLSVSRTIGDSEAKLQQFGGKSRCVVCQPEIKEIEINDEAGFILLGCDGIFDKMNNKDVIKAFLQTEISTNDYHKYTGDCINNLLNQVLLSQSQDNITSVVITFQDFLNHFENVRNSQNFQQSLKKIDEKSFSCQPDDSIIEELNKDIEQQCYGKYLLMESNSPNQLITLQNVKNKNSKNQNSYQNNLYQ